MVAFVTVFALCGVFCWPGATARSAFDAPAVGGAGGRAPPSPADYRASYAKRYAGGEAPGTCPTVFDNGQDHGEDHGDNAAAAAAAGASTHEIFLVPHAHCDVGWEWTIFGYYNNSVRHILDSVVADLGAHPAHRFIWSETKWIEMWWPRQNATTQATFRRIVRDGQFEFVGAGWSQSDEVTPSYRDIIANTVTGHEYLRRILGPLDKACPARGRCIRFGWQIDMFAGYSAATPSLWAMAGYDGMVNRFEGPNDMRAEWDVKQHYEFLWEGSEMLASERSRILTHTMRWNYGDMLLANRSGPAYGFRGPAGLTFDFGSRKLHSPQDVERYARELVSWSKHRGSVYRGNRHLAAWGSDFQFRNAGLWFEQMDLLVAEINANPEKYGNTRVRYATLSTYFDYLHALSAAATTSATASAASTTNTDATFPVKRGLDFQYGWPHTWSPVGVPLIGLTQNFSWRGLKWITALL